MNFMSVYANIYNWTRWISKFFLFYLSVSEFVPSYPIKSYGNLLNFLLTGVTYNIASIAPSINQAILLVNISKELAA